MAKSQPKGGIASSNTNKSTQSEESKADPYQQRQFNQQKAVYGNPPKVGSFMTDIKKGKS